MAEAAFGPTVFTGACEQEPESWHSSLLDYIDFKAIPDDKKLSFFKLRLADGAKDWLNALPANQKDTFDNLTATFFARFKPKDLERYRFAKELLNLRQATDQSVDQFITSLRKKAALAAADEKTQVYSALNGLIPAISGYVLEHNPKTLDDVLTHARVAELTRVTPVVNTDDITKHLAKLTEEMSRLDKTVSNLTTANVLPSPGSRQVTFEIELNKTPPSKQETYARTQQRRNLRSDQGGFSTNPRNFERPNFQGPRFSQSVNVQQPRQQRSDSTTRSYDQNACRRCGRQNGHENPLYCPMLNEKCWCCDKIGHSYRVCRKNNQNATKQF